MQIYIYIYTYAYLQTICTLEYIRISNIVISHVIRHRVGCPVGDMCLFSLHAPFKGNVHGPLFMHPCKSVSLF